MQFRDWRTDKLAELGNGQWITVYQQLDSAGEDFGFFSALVPLVKVEAVMQDVSWDLMIGHGRPGCATHHEGDQEVVEYLRFGNDDVEPFVHVRSFHGAAPNYVEVSEEFRLFHNLCFDAKRNVHMAFDESGDAEDVTVIKEDEVRIRSKYLKQYLAIRDLALLLFFDLRRDTKTRLPALGIAGRQVSLSEPEIRYEMYSGDTGSYREPATFTRLFGKKLIRGMEKEKSGIWPYDEPEKHAEYIIQRRRGSEPELWNSDPDQLGNYFGANPEAPQYLTPVFFRRDVLNKYYANPQRYSVEDGYLRASGQWGVQIDNNHPDHIVVFLGDLGRDLPYKEQLYWKSFNVEPSGSMSEVNFRRSMLGQFTSPTKPDLMFKQEFGNFNDDWQRRFGWPMFKPLSDEDEHCSIALRVPLTNTQTEFDGQVLALCKIMVDSLNEAELAKGVTHLPENAKGITKLNLFLQARGVQVTDEPIRFMRKLWDLRHGAGHRKGNAYKSAANFFQVEEKGFVSAFESILVRAIALLNFIRATVLRSAEDDIKAALPA